MIDQTLENIADKILALDEASLASLSNTYKKKMESFEASKEWEKSVIVFFIINAVRVKNQIFNDHITQQMERLANNKKTTRNIPYLKRIK